MARLGAVLFIGLSLTIKLAVANTPDWALKDSYTAKSALIVEVNREGIADLVKINTGSQSNLRIGAQCMVLRDGLHIGDIVIVESGKDRSIGLALDGSEIQNGDAVRITPAN